MNICTFTILFEITVLPETGNSEEVSYSADEIEKNLLSQLQSSSFSAWNNVAACENATEIVLLEVAKKCASINNDSEDAKQIASNIAANPAVTLKVLEALNTSPYSGVLNISHSKADDLKKFMTKKVKAP